MAGPVKHRPSGPYRSVAGTVSVSQSTQGLGRPRRHRAGRPRRAENAETLRHPDQLDGGRESLQWGQSSPAGCAAAPRRSLSTGGGALVQVQVAALAFAPWLALAPGVPAPTAKHGAPPASRRNNPAAGSHWPARKRHRVSQSSRGGGPSDVVGPPGGAEKVSALEPHAPAGRPISAASAGEATREKTWTCSCVVRTRTRSFFCGGCPQSSKCASQSLDGLLHEAAGRGDPGCRYSDSAHTETRTYTCVQRLYLAILAPPPQRPCLVSPLLCTFRLSFQAPGVVV